MYNYRKRPTNRYTLSEKCRHTINEQAHKEGRTHRHTNGHTNTYAVKEKYGYRYTHTHIYICTEVQATISIDTPYNRCYKLLQPHGGTVQDFNVLAPSPDNCEVLG